MNLDNINKWLTLAANLGVLVGILFLVIELRQNQTSLDVTNSLNRLNASKENWESISDWRQLLIQDKETRAIWDSGMAGEFLDESQDRVFGLLCQDRIWYLTTTHRQYLELGILESAEFTAQNMINFLSSPGMHDCWTELSPSLTAAGFEEFVSIVDGAGR